MFAEIAALELRTLSWKRLWRGLKNIAAEFQKYDLLTYSSAIAFQVLYAVLPLTLLGLAALGLFGVQSVFTDHIAPTLRHHLSPDAYRIAHRTALHVMNGKRVWWATAGLAVSIWGVSAAIRSMITPLNEIYGAKETRSMLRKLVVSIAGAAGVAACVYGAIVAALAVQLIHTSSVLEALVQLVRWLGTLALLFVANALVLRVAPAKKRPVRWVGLGSTLVVVCWIVATIGFAAYISAVSYSSFYGALGALVLLLVYLHVAAIAFLLGLVVDSLVREEVTRKERRARRR